MSEPSPNAAANMSDNFSFFQSEDQETLANPLDVNEIALGDALPETPFPILEPSLNSDNDCACE